MEIQPQQPLAAQNVAVESQPVISRNALSSDFETFLKMLTTQMENQDPLNPVDSAEFAMQLATFSGVEQQIRTNDILADMVGGAWRVGAFATGRLGRDGGADERTRCIRRRANHACP